MLILNLILKLYNTIMVYKYKGCDYLGQTYTDV